MLLHSLPCRLTFEDEHNTVFVPMIELRDVFPVLRYGL